MNYGFVKVAAGSPAVSVADVDANVKNIVSMMGKAHSAGANLLVLPELCVTGSTCGDLFYSETLLTAARDALTGLARVSMGMTPVFVIGLPLVAGGKLFNCAAVVHNGAILGVVPKSCASSQRQFASGAEAVLPEFIYMDDEEIPFSPDLVFRCADMPSFCVGVEFSDDLWSPDPISLPLCQSGATIIASPSASAEAAGRREYRRMLAQSASARLQCGYVQANPDWTESTQDTVCSRHNLICENGVILNENPPFGGDEMIVSEIDVQRLTGERRKNTSFGSADSDACIFFEQPVCETALTRKIEKMPFIPSVEAQMNERAEDILRIQSYGLKKRIEHTHVRTAVVGISGGLDSCLALLVMARTMDLLGRDRKDILAVSMPCFGTTKRTRSNAEAMCELLGVSFREVSIAAAVRQHFADIGHDESIHDVTYENSQARERTKVLMDLANEYNGLVVGTGDLSELALGWATYNGDHMSMYGVNAGIPKTLIRHIVRYEASRSNPELAAVLLDILDTPVSPELLPATSEGEIQQKTEDLVGPYELHDFFLYQALRYGDSPKKIYRLAKYAFDGEYSNEVILKWLRTFFRRFFMQQFKRSCLPDGPKVGTISLSPRGDWQMPSDASSALWLREIDELQP